MALAGALLTIPPRAESATKTWWSEQTAERNLEVSYREDDGAALMTAGEAIAEATAIGDPYALEQAQRQAEDARRGFTVDFATCQGRGPSWQDMYRTFRCKIDVSSASDVKTVFVILHVVGKYSYRVNDSAKVWNRLPASTPASTPKATASPQTASTGATGASHSGADSPTLVVNKRIGDISRGETRTHVEYDYGYLGRSWGCVVGFTGCIGSFHTYKVSGGTLSVGYRSVDPRGRHVEPRVVRLETDSPYYRTSGGLGVGTKIPFGKRIGPFRYEICGPGDYAWIAGPSRSGAYRWWMRLYTDRGVVKSLTIWRSDISLQGC